MRKLISTRKALVICAGIATLGVAGAMADVIEGVEYRAWCSDEQASPGGWMSYEEDAIAYAEKHLENFPDHDVTIQTLEH